MTVVRIARQRLGMQHELAARGAVVGGDDRNLDAELVGRASLAFADKGRGRNGASSCAGAAVEGAPGRPARASCQHAWDRQVAGPSTYGWQSPSLIG
jgi:hypothetical protein